MLSVKKRGRVYRLEGRVGRRRIRFSLDTGNREAALDRANKIERALSQGRESSLWPELRAVLPSAVFKINRDTFSLVLRRCIDRMIDRSRIVCGKEPMPDMTFGQYTENSCGSKSFPTQRVTVASRRFPALRRPRRYSDRSPRPRKFSISSNSSVGPNF